ncbi:MAG: DUF167 domain-containing protein [Patescibacteria group bacterium]
MYVKVKISPGSKRESLEKIREDHYTVCVREKAENNKVNKRLLELMHREFPDSLIKIISGHHSPSKIVSIDRNI